MPIVKWLHTEISHITSISECIAWCLYVIKYLRVLSSS